VNPVYNQSFLLPPVKIKEPAYLTRLVTGTRRALHYGNTEGWRKTGVFDGLKTGGDFHRQIFFLQPCIWMPVFTGMMSWITFTL
jgi:hypothetical protein